MIDVSIIVVTYKEGLDVLKACFDSVAASTGVTYELIVSDNGANEATRGLLSAYEHSTYIRNTGNLGFAKAVNRGWKLAQGRYVLLLNPDTSFASDVLEKMIHHLDADQEVGIASSLIRYPNGDLQESIRRFPTMQDQLFMLLKLTHLFPNHSCVQRYMMRDVDQTATQDVDSIMGAFMFVRRELFQKIGFLDERYFIWFEEVDYCKMAHDAGWKIRSYGDVQITHHKGHTFGKIATRRKQKWIRTSLRKYMYKHHGWLAASVFWVLTPLFIVLGFAASLIKPK